MSVSVAMWRQRIGCFNLLKNSSVDSKVKSKKSSTDYLQILSDFFRTLSDLLPVKIIVNLILLFTYAATILLILSVFILLLLSLFCVFSFYQRLVVSPKVIYLGKKLTFYMWLHFLLDLFNLIINNLDFHLLIASILLVTFGCIELNPGPRPVFKKPFRLLRGTLIAYQRVIIQEFL